MSRQQKKRRSHGHRAQSQALRIIGGQWRGRKLVIADVPGLRPTGDRIRETLFNWLGPYLQGSHCLDLFTGSGVLGLESLSRGAAKVIMVELNSTAMSRLEQHCALLKANGAKLVQEDVLAWLATSTLAKHSIDIAFIDPPFDQGLWETAFQQLIDSELLASNAFIYIESPKAEALAIPPIWQLHRNKVSGDIRYALYRSAL